MHKIVITIFALPNELDDVTRVLTDLNRASKHIDGALFEFYVTLSLSDFNVDWGSSSVSPDFFRDRFMALKPLTDWAWHSVFQIRDEIRGALSARAYALREMPNATHFIWIDPDICFDETILKHMVWGIEAVSAQRGDPRYLITPEVVRLWDATWDCLVHESFLKHPVGYCKQNNPFVDAGCHGPVSLRIVHNNVPGQPASKFGAGWFSCLSRQLLDHISLTVDIGDYGPDDTYIMVNMEYCNRAGASLYQYCLKNYVVCENYAFNDRSPWTHLLCLRDRKKQLEQQSIRIMEVMLQQRYHQT